MKALLLACLPALAACGGPDAGARALVWARSADSTTLDPGEVEWGEDIKVVRSLYEPLVAFKDESTELEGRLATGWSFSTDQKTVTFDLRRGVRFHDGTPLDAEAVVSSFRRLLDPAHPHRPRAVPHAPNFAAIARVEAAGSDRVAFALREPSAVILYNLAHYAASVVSPAAARGPRLARNPAGTGPYRLARWDPDVKLELEAFDGYWGAKPAVRRVIVVPVASPQTAIEKLRRGEVHAVDHPTLADVRALAGDPAVRVHQRESLNVCCLAFNLRHPPYDNLHFRRAVSLALDRKTLNDLAYHGMAEPAAGVVPPAVWKEPLPAYEHDLERARAELERAGLKSNQVELIHVNIARPYMPDPRRVAEFIKDSLRRIGLEVRLTGYDKSAFGLKQREEAHPMFLMGWSADYPDPDNYFYPLLHGDNAGDLNGSFFNDPGFNDAVARARSEGDPDRRRELYRKAQERYRAELPTIPLVHVKQTVVTSSRVDYRMHPVEVRFAAASFRD